MKLSDPLHLQQLHLDSQFEYSLLKSDSTHFILFREGNQVKELEGDTIKNIWNSSIDPRIALSTPIDSFNLFTWMEKNSQWPQKFEARYGIEIQCGYYIDLGEQWTLEFNSRKNNIFWNAALWSENHSNKTDDDLSYSDFGLQFGVGIPGIHFNLISNQSFIPPFLFLERNMKSSKDEPELLYDNYFRRSNLLTTRNHNWMSQVEFKIGYFEYSIWSDRETYNQSIHRLRLQGLPFYHSTWGIGYFTNLDVWMPGVWNEFSLSPLLQTQNIQSSALIAWEMWYLSSTNYNLKLNFKINTNDFFGDPK